MAILNKSAVSFCSIYAFFYYWESFFCPAQWPVEHSGNAFQNELMPGNQSWALLNVLLRCSPHWWQEYSSGKTDTPEIPSFHYSAAHMMIWINALFWWLIHGEKRDMKFHKCNIYMVRVKILMEVTVTATPPSTLLWRCWGLGRLQGHSPSCSSPLLFLGRRSLRIHLTCSDGTGIGMDVLWCWMLKAQDSWTNRCQWGQIWCGTSSLICSSGI